ncbi:ribonuclease R [Luminiphilus syltensis NOR5-1B]|uniref:Ribonuclease R n=1 Tax=Luminiphilus syltensis NOR5-1B TaxID=565045 RepID=B8KW92_9GAMM|nr:ribonuclease R [Luminiphilus syltensis]EED34585.1 ribonuclease R [Luminiphilus syltensis NOR5-1B]
MPKDHDKNTETLKNETPKKKSRGKKQSGVVDPHAEREAARYDNPIPSREVILGLLDAAEGPMGFEQLTAALQLEDEDARIALQRRLGAMQRDGQLMANRRGKFGLATRMNLQTCRVIGHRDGYGFAKPEEGGDDLFLNNRQMQRVFDGDKVLAAIIGQDRRGRPEGQIVEVLERAHAEIVGRYVEEGGIGYVVPHHNRITAHLLIPPKRKKKAKPGQVVTATITDYPTAILGAKGEITEILGDHLDPGLEIDIAIRSHGIPYEWPDEVLAEAASLRDEPTPKDKEGRVDLRQKAFVTIDGEDAKDFDDAVYCEREGQGFRLWVAIADVSHYVAVGSAMDEEAAERGNSVYFPERVVPMFPEVLSNGLCSLKPKVDRLAMVCEMSIGADGQLLDSVFYESVIHSHARLTYTEVGTVLAEGTHPDVKQAYIPDLMRLHDLYKILRAARDRRGAIDFETTETRIVFNDERKIEAIVPVTRNDAHKLIEECMLIANVATARFLDDSGIPALFRVHEGPSAQRLENLRAFLGELALDLPGGETPTPEDYQKVLALTGDREDGHIIQTMMLRSLSQAAYQPDNGGHFGLHYDAYAHFTSPIRRYPDLLVHRLIRHLIRSDIPLQQVRRLPGVSALKKSSIYPYTAADMSALGEQCSASERRADEATREVEAWLKCEFLRDKVGEVFSGVVAAVTNFGIFVELADLYIEGLVHISALPGDYYQFDTVKHRLIGERTRRVYQLGTPVVVQVARVDLDDRKIDLEFPDSDGVSSEGEKPAAKKGKPKGRSRRGAGKPGKKGEGQKKAEGQKKTQPAAKKATKKSPAKGRRGTRKRS